MQVQDPIAARLPRQVDTQQWIDPEALPETRAHLTRLLETFNDAMHRGLEPAGLTRLSATLEGLDALYRPYAIEGSGMAAALIGHYHGPVGAVDLPKKRSARRLFSLGFGMGLAFVDADPARLPAAAPPAARLRWVQDGFGFYRCMRDGIDRTELAQPWSYSGLGRALWFRTLSDPTALVGAVARHTPLHQTRIWHGIGVAAAFTGGVSPDELRSLRERSGPHEPHLLRGALTGIEMRGDTRAPLLPGPSVFTPSSFDRELSP